MFDYIIVGAGFAGSVLAERIARVLNKKVLIIEKREHIGGNCYDERIEDILVHRYGPHLFHTNDKEVWDYLSQFTEWSLYQHRVLAFIDGQKVPIPFNLNTLFMLFPLSLSQTIEEKLTQRYSYNSKIPIYKLLEEKDKDLKFLADFIYEKIFKNYTAKQWGLKLENLDSGVVSRVPVVISRDNRYFSDKYQGVPHSGYAQLFKKMLRHPNIKVLLNTDFKEILDIDSERKKIYLFGQEFRGKLVFTGMIDELFDYKFGELPYRSVDMKFNIIENEYFQEVATVNYPNDYDFTRITEFKHIHPINSKKTVILKEYPQSYIRGKNIPYYPVFTKENQEKYESYLEYSQKFCNVVLVGRLAEYKYYDMDDIVKRALEVFEEKIR